MNRTALTLAAVLSVAAVAAHAEDADPSGQFAATIAPQATRAQVVAQYNEFRASGVNPWSTSYNQLTGFKGRKTREQVRADYLASRDAVAAMTGEDSGSAFLSARATGSTASRQLAGEPVRSAE